MGNLSKLLFIFLFATSLAIFSSVIVDAAAGSSCITYQDCGSVVYVGCADCINNQCVYNVGAPCNSPGWECTNTGTCSPTTTTSSSTTTTTLGGESGCACHVSTQDEPGCQSIDKVKGYSSCGNCAPGEECCCDTGGSPPTTLQGNTCTDTDSGIDPYNPGKVTYNSVVYKDEANGQTLKEYYCESLTGPVKSVTGTCPVWAMVTSDGMAYCLGCRETSDGYGANGKEVTFKGTLEYVNFTSAADKWGYKKIATDTCAMPLEQMTVGDQGILNNPFYNGKISLASGKDITGRGLIQFKCSAEDYPGDPDSVAHKYNTIGYRAEAMLARDQIDTTVQDPTPLADYVTSCQVIPNDRYGCYDGGCLWENAALFSVNPSSPNDPCPGEGAKRCAPGSNVNWQRCSHQTSSLEQCQSCVLQCSDRLSACYNDGEGQYTNPWVTSWMAPRCGPGSGGASEYWHPCVPKTHLVYGVPGSCVELGSYSPYCNDNTAGYSIRGDISNGPEGSPCRTCDYNQEACGMCKGNWIDPAQPAGQYDKIEGGCCDSSFYDDYQWDGSVVKVYPDCGKGVGNKICDAKAPEQKEGDLYYNSYINWPECWKLWDGAKCLPIAPFSVLSKGGTWKSGVTAGGPVSLTCDASEHLYDGAKWFKAEGNCTEVNATGGKMWLDYKNSSWKKCDSTLYYTAVNCTVAGAPTEYFCTEDGWKTDVKMRCTPDKSECDYCSRENMCLLNPDSKTNALPDPRCIYVGDYNNDDYCLNGTWSTRTALVATQLLEFAQGKDYTLFCDEPLRALNDQTELLFPGDAGPWLSGTNKYCTLQYKDGNNIKRALGTSLNKDFFVDTEIYGFLQGVLKLPADYCANAITTEDRFKQCNTNMVWWNNKTQLIIYANNGGEGIGLQQSPLGLFLVRFKQFLYDPINVLINAIKAAFAGEPMQLNKYFKDVSDFDRYYEAVVGNKVVKGFIRDEADCTPDHICGKYVSVDFKNVDEDICKFVNKWDAYDGNSLGDPNAKEIHCTQSVTGNEYYVVSHASQETGGEFAAIDKIWSDLTAKLRVK